MRPESIRELVGAHILAPHGDKHLQQLQGTARSLASEFHRRRPAEDPESAERANLEGPGPVADAQRWYVRNEPPQARKRSRVLRLDSMA